MVLTADRVPENDYTVLEASLFDQLEAQPDAIREEMFSATDEHGADDYLELVDKTRPYGLRREFATVNREAVLGAGLEPLDRAGIEFTLDLRPPTARLGEGPEVDDLFRRLLRLRKVEHELRLIGNRVRGFPYTMVSYIFRP